MPASNVNNQLQIDGPQYEGALSSIALPDTYPAGTTVDVTGTYVVGASNPADTTSIFHMYANNWNAPSGEDSAVTSLTGTGGTFTANRLTLTDNTATQVTLRFSTYSESGATRLTVDNVNVTVTKGDGGGTTPPTSGTVNIISPTNGSTVPQGNLTVSGSATANLTFTVNVTKSNGTVAAQAQATADASGTWSVSTAVWTGGGNYTITASGTGVTSNTVNITVSSPVVISVPADGATVDSSQDIFGTATPNSTVQVEASGPGGLYVWQATSDASGNWQVNPDWTAGTYQVLASAAGQQSNIITVTVASAPPVGLVVDIQDPVDGSTVSAGVPYIVSGTATPDSTFILNEQNSGDQTVMVNGSGQWFIQVTSFATGTSQLAAMDPTTFQILDSVSVIVQ